MPEDSGIVLADCIYIRSHLLSSECSLTVIGCNHGLWWKAKRRLSELQEAEDQGKPIASLLEDGARSTVSVVLRSAMSRESYLT